MGSFWWMETSSSRAEIAKNTLFFFYFSSCFFFSLLQVRRWRRRCGPTSMSAPIPTASSASTGPAASSCRRTSRRACKSRFGEGGERS